MKSIKAILLIILVVLLIFLVIAVGEDDTVWIHPASNLWGAQPHEKCDQFSPVTSKNCVEKWVGFDSSGNAIEGQYIYSQVTPNDVVRDTEQAYYLNFDGSKTSCEYLDGAVWSSSADNGNGECCGDDVSDCGFLSTGALCSYTQTNNWFWGEATTNRGNILESGCGGEFSYLSDGNEWIICDSKLGGDKSLTSSQLVNTNTDGEVVWWHVAATAKANGEMKLYIDGEEVGSQNISSLKIDSSNLKIGGPIQGLGGFQGSVDEVMIYNKALDESVIDEHANKNLACGCGSPKNEKGDYCFDGVVAYYPIQGNFLDKSFIKPYFDGENYSVEYHTGWTTTTAEFKGTDKSYIELPKEVYSGGDLSVSVWARPNIDGGDKDGILVSMATPTQHNYFRFGEFDSIKVFINGNSYDTKVNINDNKWHHLMATFDNSEKSLKMYIDGVQKGIWTTTKSLDSAPTKVVLGNDIHFGSGNQLIMSSDGEAFSYLMDKISIFDKPLTPVEVRQIYDGYANDICGISDCAPGETGSICEAGLIGYYRFEEATTGIGPETYCPWDGTYQYKTYETGGLSISCQNNRITGISSSYIQDGPGLVNQYIGSSPTTYCDFSGWLYRNDYGTANDMGFYCSNNVLAGICQNCGTPFDKNVMNCPWDGTWGFSLYNGKRINLEISCYNNKVVGICNSDETGCPTARDYQQGVYFGLSEQTIIPPQSGDTSTTAHDFSNAANEGEFSGTTSHIDNGVIGQAFVSPGSGKVTIDSIPHLNEFTIEMWIDPATKQAMNFIGRNEPIISLTSDGRVKFQINDSFESSYNGKRFTSSEQAGQGEVSNPYTFDQHDYLCYQDSDSSLITECCGGSATQSTLCNNDEDLGGVSLSAGQSLQSAEDIYFCKSDYSFSTDLDDSEFVCNNAKYPNGSSLAAAWTGTQCCSEPEDEDETYNDLNGTGACLLGEPLLNMDGPSDTYPSLKAVGGVIRSCGELTEGQFEFGEIQCTTTSTGSCSNGIDLSDTTTLQLEGGGTGKRTCQGDDIPVSLYFRDKGDDGTESIECAKSYDIITSNQETHLQFVDDGSLSMIYRCPAGQIMTGVDYQDSGDNSITGMYCKPAQYVSSIVTTNLYVEGRLGTEYNVYFNEQGPAAAYVVVGVAYRSYNDNYVRQLIVSPLTSANLGITSCSTTESCTNSTTMGIDSVDSCYSDEESGYYCDIDDEWKQGDKPTHSVVPDDWKPMAVEEACCDVGRCWNGTTCLPNQIGNPLSNDIDGYRCVDGGWAIARPKRPLDGGEWGFCPKEEQCLVSVNGNPDDNDNPLGNPICISDGQFIRDGFCENGYWGSRAKILAGHLMLTIDPTLDYTLYCGPYHDTLNYFRYFQNGIFAQDLFEQGKANNVCVLEQNGNLFFATSMNGGVDIVGLSNLISEFNGCNPGQGGGFLSCNQQQYDKVWVNNDIQSIMYSKTDFTFTTAFNLNLTIQTIEEIFDNEVVTSLKAEPSTLRFFDPDFTEQGLPLDILYFVVDDHRLKHAATVVDGRLIGKYGIFQPNLNYPSQFCNTINAYNARLTTLASNSEIFCIDRQLGDEALVVAIGGEFADINPFLIYPDMTGKLR